MKIAIKTTVVVEASWSMDMPLGATLHEFYKQMAAEARSKLLATIQTGKFITSVVVEEASYVLVTEDLKENLTPEPPAQESIPYPNPPSKP